MVNICSWLNNASLRMKIKNYNISKKGGKYRKKLNNENWINLNK